VRLLFVSPEIFPMAKTGGLGDVSGALPAALADADVDVRLVMPAYPGALAAVVDKRQSVPLADFKGLGRANVIEARTPDSGLPIFLIDCPALYDRAGGPYQDERGREWPDNVKRFGMLSRAAAELAVAMSPGAWLPDVVHAHDWQTGLVPALLAVRPEPRPASVFTIHNMGFPGIFPASTFPLLGLPTGALSAGGVEYYKQVSLLKAGLVYADHLTTVSPTYAREIQTPQFGFGFDSLLRARADRLSGILNGVDYRVWDPAVDTQVKAQYSVADLSGKAACKTALQTEMDLDPAPTAPLIGVISRLTSQKGLDLVLQALPPIIKGGSQFVLLGAGDPVLQRRFLELGARHPRRVAVRLAYDEGLAHRIEAGSDMYLMPSRFEPCGLNQMYSLRYGTPPIVHAVGGLADSVVDATEANLSAGTATGFVFRSPNANALREALRRALELFGQRERWLELQRTGMRQDFGWAGVAKLYVALYEFVRERTTLDARSHIAK
jgi:starch synthase